MRIDHIVARLDQEAAGPFASVSGLLMGLASPGDAEVHLHALGGVPELPGVRTHGYRQCRLPHPAWGRSPELKRALGSAAKRANVLHVHGLWMLPNIYPGRAVLGTRCQVVCAPRGMLTAAALKRSTWKKRLSGWIGQREMLARVRLFHVTSALELQALREAGYRAAAALIPNGVSFQPAAEDPAIATQEAGSPRRVLFLGRLHPIKGIELLLDAWATVAAARPDWELVITGPEYRVGYRAALRRRVRRLGAPRVRFEGAVGGADKWARLRSAELLVLPSQTENFGMVVAETLACGVPALVTAGAPWEGLNTRNAGWFVPRKQTAVSAALRTAMALPTVALRARGERGRAWMRKDFAWSGLARELRVVYGWLCGGGPRPGCVHLD